MHIAYIAGFFDGEGTVWRAPQTLRVKYLVQFAQGERTVLEQIQTELANRNVHSSLYVSPRASHHKTMFYLRVASLADATRTLKLMLPYLVVKHAAAMAALSANRELMNKYARRDATYRRAVAHYLKGNGVHKCCKRFPGVNNNTLIKYLRADGLLR